MSKISMENLKGRKVPRGSLRDQTKNKAAGTRNVRGPMNSPVNFAPRGSR